MRKYGTKRDTHDHRDRLMNLRVDHLPFTVDLRPFCGLVKDQGQEGSCTGHAGSSCVEWILKKYQSRDVRLSPQDLYVQELIQEGSYPSDNGAMPRTICKVLTASGVCEEALYPYEASQLKVPTIEQNQNATRYKQGAYHRLTSARDVLSCLGDPVPWPVLVGFAVYQSFESQAVAQTGVMPMPAKNEMLLGGHEVLAVGYDIGSTPNLRPKDSPPAALIQNSWGTGWGQSGFFWMPLQILDDPQTDMWMVHPGHWV